MKSSGGSSEGTAPECAQANCDAAVAALVLDLAGIVYRRRRRRGTVYMARSIGCYLACVLSPVHPIESR